MKVCLTVKCSLQKKPSSPNRAPNRRKLLFGSFIVIPNIFKEKQSIASSEKPTTPYQEAQNIQYGLLNGRIRTCPTNINPNCVSTSSINSSYSPAWRSAEQDALTSAEVLEGAFKRLFPEESRLIDARSSEDGEYRAFGVDSLFGQDVVEFMIRNGDPVKDNRNWEGDTEGPIVTYRSMAGSVKYVWPIQQAVSDFGTQKKRLDMIRNDLGWRIVGCELLECYE
eukprot:TRINITY_DN6851_c0_g2_i1.p3 TRINITY_DN6851_c0_g2~~TRINITY_DN6851_c0_g2_i1.p3  ORF type:complete len:224 (-),score=26.98 TRINITY_DN6851_c0_g2_i1:712-1383(-)